MKLLKNVLNHFLIDITCVHLLCYKCHKINFKQGGSYIDSSDWIKTKKHQKILSIKRIINVFNTLTVALSHEEIKRDLQRITKLNLL